MGNLSDGSGNLEPSFSFRAINTSVVYPNDIVNPGVLSSDRLKDLRGLGRAIYAQLSSDPIIKEAIGTAIFPLISPQVSQIYPCVVYSLNTLAPDYTMDGRSGLAMQTATVSVLAKDYGTMDALGNAVFNSLDFGDGDWGGILVQGCFYRGESEEIEAFQQVGVESDVYIRSMNFEIHFNLPCIRQ